METPPGTRQPVQAAPAEQQRAPEEVTSSAQPVLPGATVDLNKLLDDPEFRGAVSTLIRDLLPFFRQRHQAIATAAGRASKWSLVVGGGGLLAVIVVVGLLVWFGKVSGEMGGVLFGVLANGVLGFLRENGPWWGHGAGGDGAV